MSTANFHETLAFNSPVNPVQTKVQTWILLQEELWINTHLKRNTYKQNYQAHADNTINYPLIDFLVQAI